MSSILSCSLKGRSLTLKAVLDFSVPVTEGHSLEDSQVPGQSLTTLILPIGHYCPAGISSAQPCPEGTLNPQEGAISPRACQLCPAGSYCPGEGNIWPEGRYRHDNRDRQSKAIPATQALTVDRWSCSYGTLSGPLRIERSGWGESMISMDRFPK